MEEWKEYKLGDVCSRLKSGKGISSSSILENAQYPVIGGNGIRGYVNTANFKGECAVIGRQGAYCGNVRYFNGEAYMTEHAVVAVGNSNVNTRYLACLLARMQLGNLSAQSAQPGLSVQILSKLLVKLPPLYLQNKIAAVVKSIDDKIELNRRINDNLEQQAQALFKSWFVDFEPWGGKMPNDWKEGTLLDIADYLNGLAMQKYPSKEGFVSLPVLKIKELGQGYCDDASDRCTSTISSQYIVNDGDVIFSWSGTLLVDIWCGGVCGLNQHLYKVTSKSYPKWFYLYWTISHLEEFRRIASDKAVTMGHIKRGDLEKAKVLIPPITTIATLSNQITPMIENIINVRKENTKLAQLRDTLVPRLMSGELKIS